MQNNRSLIQNNNNFFFKVDENGLKIKLDKIMEEVTLIHFINLSIKEKKMILEWRNSSEIKNWMYSKDDITLENHLHFIDLLELSKDQQYFVVKKGNKYIGVVDFTEIDYKNSSTYFGLYTNPLEKMKGCGSILQELCIQYAFDVLKLNKIKLEVFSDNLKAIHLYKKFKFKERNKKIVNGKNVIFMELNKHLV